MSEEPFASFLRSTIQEAGALLRSLSSMNGAVEPVTGHECDLEVNGVITKAIRRHHPHHRYISEEESQYPRKRDAFTWIIDPIDGSENFYRGLSSYTISISLVRADEILLGAVYEPYIDRLYFASRGGGATMNGRQIRVSGIGDMSRAACAISGYSSFQQASTGGADLFRKIVESVEVRITSSTALDMCYVAAGALEARIMANTRIWDNSAATLIVREAGGAVTDWYGRPGDMVSPQLLASNGLCHQGIIALLSRADTQAPREGVNARD